MAIDIVESISNVLAIGVVIALAGIVYPFKPFGNRWLALSSFMALLVAFGLISPNSTPPNTSMQHTVMKKPFINGDISDEELATSWVVAERLNRRTCPSVNCGIVGQFFLGQKVEVYEQVAGWARVSKPYDASCLNGRSEYVDSGNNTCSLQNGIESNKLSEWVSATYVSEIKPSDPAASAKSDEGFIAQSDDFLRYRGVFLSASTALIEQRRCNEADFREMGGWAKSFTHKEKPIYFTYCGGGSLAHRLYLDASTGKVFQ